MLVGCITTHPVETNKFKLAMKKVWPDAQIIIISQGTDNTAKVSHHGKIFDVNYTTDWFGHIKFQSIALEGFK